MYRLVSPGTLELAALSSEAFTHITHPAFPGADTRVKKSEFSYGGVKCVHD